jgi:4-hydroxy-tetrahydrodipicolinate synthase
MKKGGGSKPLFRGAATALVTPMTESGVDYDALERLIEYQIDGGVSALLCCGTTGENPTLTDAERREVTAFTVRASAGRAPVIAGVGSNNTYRSCALARDAEAAGASALLAVTPYYNKATDEGMISHFTEIASASSLPVMLYNVPSRTGVSIPKEVVLRLSENPRICGIKEASGDMGYACRLSAVTEGDFPIWSGCDDITVPMMAAGGIGVVSVVSNIMPREVAAMCRLFHEGDICGASNMQRHLSKLCDCMFKAVNPIPVKAALHMMGMAEARWRLPLCPPDDETAAEIRAVLEEYGLV